MKDLFAGGGTPFHSDGEIKYTETGDKDRQACATTGDIEKAYTILREKDKRNEIGLGCEPNGKPVHSDYFWEAG
jgi:hypothetical protein